MRRHSAALRIAGAWRAAGVWIVAFCAVPALCGADAASQAFYANHFETQPSAPALSALGRALFFDPALSASGKTSCASCHSPAHAYGPPKADAVVRAGIDGTQPGLRAVPSLEYQQNLPPFTLHHVDDEGDDSIDQGPTGGHNWDGRSDSTHDQARSPLLSPFEMANADFTAVVARVQRGAAAAQFRATFGERVFADPALAFQGVLRALETFQQEPSEFYPYTSKYDAWLRHQTALSAEEQRGLEAFNDPARGNCARCHSSAIREGAFPQFTDFGFAGLGVPRNAAIPANADPRYFDLGVCGPLRTDLAGRTEVCGLFRTPSLRNVAIRQVFFHNGVVHSLEDAVRFYAERDTRPERWYPRSANVGRGYRRRGGDHIQKFDDVPAPYQRNLERAAPFGRRVGERPALSQADVKAIVAFLRTLTDGYVPHNAVTPASSVRLCERVMAMNSRMYAASAPALVVAAYSSQRKPCGPMGRDTT
jgi:cytochrome c peroxidase